jgi:serine/threonine protein kinase
LATTSGVSVIQTVREYELHELLGGGGMGEVYRARHVLLDQPYAVKVVLPALLQNAEIRARFLREAQTLQRLDHPNILRFVTLFEDAGRLFLVTELLAGQPLDLYFHDAANVATAAPTGWGSPGPEPAVRVDFFHQTVRGVAHAHRRGILHRDLKPGNLHVLPDGRIKILDFGIARPIAARALTAMGHLVGTPVYLPPEIILGETASSAAGPAWDVYTLGLLAYEMFTGQLPFDLDPNAPPLQLLNDLSRFYARRSRGPDVRSKVPGLSRAWSEAIERALAPDPARRPADAGALLRLLDAAPALTDTTAQTVLQSTENLAPEDATGIHDLRRPPVPAPPGLGGGAGPVPVHSLPEETQVVSLDSDLLSARSGAPLRSAEPGKPSPTTRTRFRAPAWVGPAVGAFALGLGVALLVSTGGADAPAVSVAGERAATSTEKAASPAAPSTMAPTPPSTAAPPQAAETEPDAGALDFEPVAVGSRPKAPRSGTPRPDRDREPARPGAAVPSVQASGTSNTAATHGVLSVVADPPALVYLGDTYISESPVRGRLVKPGRYEVKLVRTVMPRPYRRTVSITVRPGQRVEVRHDEPAPRRR